MNITLEEQIEYMRAEQFIPSGNTYYLTTGAYEAADIIKSILATLETVRDERNGMVKIRNLAPGKPDTGT